MIILYFLFIPSFYIIFKIITHFVVSKYGYFSYQDFSAAGFKYDSKNKTFYATKNAWQKNFGYTHAYDVWAPLLQMIIDTETIRFYYDDKNYLISFWKGQYGMTTGAEVGIYTTNALYVDKNTLYFPAALDDMLNMSFTLFKKGVKIMDIKAKHWWLAIFKLGMFSKPKDLTMDITIEFKNREMLQAFLASFKRLGYQDKDYQVVDNTFYFKFIKPKTRKVWTRIWLVDKIREHINKRNVKLYNKYLIDLIKDTDEAFKLEKLIPEFLKNKEEILVKEKQNVIYLNTIVAQGKIE